MSGRSLKSIIKLSNKVNMLSKLKNYTVESVLAGHPDKVCDQICDAILDRYLEGDENSKVSVECLGSGTFLIIGGEVSSNTNIKVEGIAQAIYNQIGYDNKLTILNKINIQSVQLRRVVDIGAAGDQGTMYGFACNSEFNFLPYGVYLINAIAKEIDLLRKQTSLYLPDGKVQVTFKGNCIDTLVISVQHSKDSNIDYLRSEILEKAVSKIIPLENIKTVLFNHNSSFINGGFINDTGLSGRKIINDTYCGLIPHGGGSFSGKDPSKVDRSAAYMTRFVAKNIVANEISKSCLISASYAFGVEEPLMLEVLTDNDKNNLKVAKLVLEKFDFRPNAIIERLGLKRTKYQSTSTYGHFFESTYNWEKVVSI